MKNSGSGRPEVKLPLYLPIGFSGSEKCNIEKIGHSLARFSTKFNTFQQCVPKIMHCTTSLNIFFKEISPMKTDAKLKQNMKYLKLRDVVLGSS